MYIAYCIYIWLTHPASLQKPFLFRREKNLRNKSTSDVEEHDVVTWFSLKSFLKERWDGPGWVAFFGPQKSTLN